MNLIVTESAQIKIECSGSTGVGTIMQGTIPISGAFTGSCMITPTYSNHTTIDGFKVVTKLNFSITGFIAGTIPGMNGSGSMIGSTKNILDDNLSLVTSNQTCNLTNGTYITTSTPPVTTPYVASVSFINAGQSSTYGE